MGGGQGPRTKGEGVKALVLKGRGQGPRTEGEGGQGPHTKGGDHKARVPASTAWLGQHCNKLATVAVCMLT